MLYVARKSEDVIELIEVDPIEGYRTEHERYAKLMGFPQTAIDAFMGKIPKFEGFTHHLDSKIIFGMILSKDHKEEELDFLRKRDAILKEFSPTIYNKLQDLQNKKQ